MTWRHDLPQVDAVVHRGESSAVPDGHPGDERTLGHGQLTHVELGQPLRHYNEGRLIGASGCEILRESYCVGLVVLDGVPRVEVRPCVSTHGSIHMVRRTVRPLEPRGRTEDEIIRRLDPEPARA